MVKALKIMFTIFVVALIVLPLPPSTIIGLAIVSNKKTAKLMDQKSYDFIMAVFGMSKNVVVAASTTVADAKTAAAKDRIKRGVVRL